MILPYVGTRGSEVVCYQSFCDIAHYSDGFYWLFRCTITPTALFPFHNSNNSNNSNNNNNNNNNNSNNNNNNNINNNILNLTPLDIHRTLQVSVTPTPLLLEGLQRRAVTVCLDTKAYRRLQSKEDGTKRASENEPSTQNQQIEILAKGFLQPWEQKGLSQTVQREVIGSGREILCSRKRGWVMVNGLY